MKNNSDQYFVWISLILILITTSIRCDQNLFKPDVNGAFAFVSASKAGLAYGVCAESTTVFVVNNSGLVQFNVQDATHPEKLGSINLGTTFGVVASNGLVYLTGSSGLSVINVTSPTHLFVLGNFQIEGVGHRIAVSDSLAFVAGSEGVDIINIKDAAHLRRISRFFCDGEAWGIACHEELIYFTDSGKGLRIIDVADPGNPREVRTVHNTQKAWDVHIAGDRLYLACHTSGIQVFDISDKRNPALLGRYTNLNGKEALGIWGVGNLVFVANNYSAELYDFSNPADIDLLGVCNGLDGAHDIDVEGDRVYIAEGKQGLIILEWNN